jgi:hypothetical protein
VTFAEPQDNQQRKLPDDTVANSTRPLIEHHCNLLKIIVNACYFIADNADHSGRLKGLAVL